MAPETQASSALGGAPWQLSLLGRVRAHGAAGNIDRFPSRAVVALAARLALAPGRSHPREELVELLWPGVETTQGRARLRQALSVLRSLLEPDTSTANGSLLQADRHSITLIPGAVDCDVLSFERLVASGHHAEARALYLGELMPGFYDDWIVEERHRLVALFDKIEASAWAGVPAHAANGHAALASAAATAARVPAAAPAERPGLARTAATGLPAYRTRAFGQGDGVAAVCSAVLAHRLVTLVAPGGQGKTRLSVAAAQALVASNAVLAREGATAPFERVLFVPLADCTDSAGTLEAMAAALKAGGPGSAKARIVESLEQCAALCVLDNAEQLDDAAAQALDALLRDAPALHLLVTSRRVLGVEGEQVLDLPGLELPSAEAPLSQAAQTAAVALFIDRARASRPEFHLTAGNLAAVVGLVRLLCGMPLAIELAASRLRVLPPQALLERLLEHAGSPLLDLLARPNAASAQARHASMRHVITWSWKLLRPEVASMLRALSVFAAPVGIEFAAQAQAALASNDSPAIAPAGMQALLAEAAEASMLQAVGSQPGLFALPPPVREYAAEQCSAEEACRVRSRTRRWLAQMAEQHLPQGSRRLRHDLHHAPALLLSAQRDSASVDALQLAVSMRAEWNSRPVSQALLQALECALQDVVASGEPRHRPLVSLGHYVMAQLNQIGGSVEHAIGHAEQACLAAPDDAHLAINLSMRANLWLHQGHDLATASQWLDDGLTLARSVAHTTQGARALTLILRMQTLVAVNYFEDYAKAEPLITECVQVQQTLGDPMTICHRQVDLAVCWFAMGRKAAAAALLEQVVAECRRHEASIVTVAALTQLGRLYLRMGQAQLVVGMLSEAALMAAEHGWLVMQLPALLHLPEAWILASPANHAGRAALLQGYTVAAWERRWGPINKIETRELKRARRLIRLALGGERTKELLLAGAALTARQAMELVHDQGAGASSVLPPTAGAAESDQTAKPLTRATADRCAP